MMLNPYQIIKSSIASGIASGQWRVGEVLPSETALCKRFAVSRMTVNRAMRELARERLINRVPGRGSFVAEPVAQSGLVQICNIADEIRARGGVHRSSVIKLGWADAAAGVAEVLGAPRVFHSVLVHYENDVALQIEDRFVSPEMAPGYLDQDFARVTPNAFLMGVAPLSEVEHVVQAAAASAYVASLLGVDVGSPCLLVHRKTWSGGHAVSVAVLYHPGARFRLSGRFSA
jgi:GntR family histidine utilization transcriptional repressor